MRRMVACAAAVLLLVFSSGCPRSPSGPGGSNGLSVSAGYIPADSPAVAVVRVQKIMQSKLLAPLFQDPKIAGQLKHLPVDLSTIDEVTMAAVPRKGEKKEWDGPFCPVAVVRFTAPTDAKGFMTRLAPPGGPKFEDRTHEGKTYIYAARDMSFFQADDRTLVLAEQEDTLKEILAGTAKSPIAEKLRAAGAADEVLGVVLVEPLRAMIKDAEKAIPPQAMATPEGTALAAVPDQLKTATLTVNLSSETLLTLALECTSADAGQKVGDTLKKAMDTFKPLAGMGVVALKSAPEGPPWEKAGLDVALQLLDAIKITPAGDKVTVAVAKPKGLEQLVAMAPQMIAEAEKKAQQGAVQAMRSVNLRQIGMAMIINEQAMQSFPTNIYDKQGKPLLSWRVAILPFLEEKTLYDQFHLDEPWDSPNNQKLLARMPQIYQGKRTEKDGKTSILVFTGKDSPFEEGKKLSMRDITDGTSATIMAVEAGPDKAVPWTKPEDLPFDPNNPRAALGAIPPEGFFVLMFDSSSHLLRGDISPETLKRLINPRDGQPVNLDEVEVGSRPKARVKVGPGMGGKVPMTSPAQPIEKYEGPSPGAKFPQSPEKYEKK